MFCLHAVIPPPPILSLAISIVFPSEYSRTHCTIPRIKTAWLQDFHEYILCICSTAALYLILSLILPFLFLFTLSFLLSGRFSCVVPVASASPLAPFPISRPLPLYRAQRELTVHRTNSLTHQTVQNACQRSSEPLWSLWSPSLALFCVSFTRLKLQFSFVSNLFRSSYSLTPSRTISPH